MFTEGFYFYQFSYAESPEHVNRIGQFMAGKKKDPLLKICIGIYGENRTLDDPAALKAIESICAAAEKFEDFVPILHFTFKNSLDPKRDISLIKEKMPFRPIDASVSTGSSPTSSFLSIFRFRTKPTFLSKMMRSLTRSKSTRCSSS